jgi:hypothetical protein
MKMKKLSKPRLRNAVETIYKPYRYLFAIGRNLPRVTFGCMFLCWMPSLILYAFFYHHPYIPLIKLAFFFNLIILFMALLLSMIIHEVCGTTIIVSELSITKKSPYKTALIYFQNITQFRFVRIPLAKGYGLLRVPSGAVRLPFIFNHMDKCIDEIRSRLAAHEKGKVFDDRNIREFTVRARIDENAVGRMEQAIPFLFQAVIGSMTFSVLVAHFFWEPPMKLTFFWTFFGPIIWAIIGAIFPIFGFAIAEIFMQTRTTSLIMRNDDRELIDKLKIYPVAAIITGMAYFFSGIIFKKILALL